MIETTILAPTLGDLRSYNQWVVWNRGRRGEDGKRAKVPHDPKTGAKAKVNNSASWSSFEQASTALASGQYAGLGFVFTADDPFAGIDLDDCRDPDSGVIEPWAQEVIDQLDSYAEVSPSGTGIKLILRGTLPGGGGKGRVEGQSVEVYDRGRYFTLTGQHVAGTSSSIEERQDEIAALYIEHLTDRAGNNGHFDRFTVLKGVPEGERDDSLFRLACSDQARGVPIEDAERHILEAAAKCDPPFDEETALEKVHRAYARYDRPHNTDSGNALRLVKRHGRDLRFVPVWNKWLIWTGKHWKVDDTLEIIRRAKETVRSIYTEASEEEDEDRRRALAKWAADFESRGRISNMIELAKGEAGIVLLPDQLDRDPLLLNCQNGTIDLTTGELREHRREDLITNITPVPHDPEAGCPLFESYLDYFLHRDDPKRKAELIGFIQRVAGYSLTGLATTKAIFMPYGEPDTGKTTLVETFEGVLGPDYASAIPESTIMAKRQDGIPNDIARLKGVRLAVVSETNEDMRLNEGRIKAMTGRNKLTGRFLHGEFFDFVATHKLWIETNHRPIVSGSDRAVWNRIKLIPFTREMPKDQQDERFPERRREEYPGILAWMVRGAMAWRREGLNEPEEVTLATEEYRKEMDTVGEFIEETCQIGEDQRVNASALYKAYRGWAESRGDRPISQTSFGNTMRARGYDKRKVHGGVMNYFGIGLTPAPSLQEGPFGSP